MVLAAGGGSASLGTGHLLFALLPANFITGDYEYRTTQSRDKGMLAIAQAQLKLFPIRWDFIPGKVEGKSSEGCSSKLRYLLGRHSCGSFGRRGEGVIFSQIEGQDKTFQTGGFFPRGVSSVSFIPLLHVP